MSDYQNSLLLRRMNSQRQVLETMAEFWENHFNVPVSADGVYTWRMRYGNAIRARALGSFESLLQAVSVHPAMGMYLGNAVSDKEHPNENQGRELLELHTVGLGAGYSEAMVVDSARILTGWRVDMWDTWAAFYDAGSHYTQAGPRPRLPQQEPLDRRPPGHPRLPALPRAPPGDRARTSPASSPPRSSPTPRRRPW